MLHPLDLGKQVEYDGGGGYNMVRLVVKLKLKVLQQNSNSVVVSSVHHL